MTVTDTLYRSALWVAIIGLAAWGLGLAYMPDLVHGIGNTDPMNRATTATLGAALVGLAIVLLCMATDQQEKLAQAAAIAVALLVLMRLYLMFGNESVLVNTATLGSVVIGAVVAIIMFMKGYAPAATPKKK